MIDSFRSSLKGWFSSAIIVVIAVAMGSWGMHYYQSNEQDSVVATINGISVTHRIIENNATALERLITKNNSTLNNEILKANLNHQYKTTGRLNRFLNEHGYTVPDAVLVQSIAERHQKDLQSINFNQLINYLSQNQGLPTELYLELERSNRQTLMMSNALITSAYAGKQHMDTLSRLLNQDRNIITYSITPKDPEPVVDSQVSQYYHQHKQNLQSKNLVTIDYLVLDKSNLNVPSPTDEEIQEQYNQNPPQVKDKVNYSVVEIAISSSGQKISSEEQQSIQSEFVQPDGSNVMIVNEWLSKPNVEIAKHTEQKNINDLDHDVNVHQITTTATETKLILKKVLSFTTKKQPFSEAKKGLKSNIISERVDELFSQMQMQLSERSFSSNDLDSVAESFSPSLKKQTSAWFSDEAKNPDIIQIKSLDSSNLSELNKTIQTIAFTNELTAERRNSEVIPYNYSGDNPTQQGAIVFRVHEHRSPSTMTLEEARSIIVKKIQKKQLDDWVQSTIVAIKKDPHVKHDHVSESKNVVQWSSHLDLIAPEYYNTFIQDLWTYGQGSFYLFNEQTSKFLKDPSVPTLIYIENIALRNSSSEEKITPAMPPYFSLYSNSVIHEKE